MTVKMHLCLSVLAACALVACGPRERERDEDGGTEEGDGSELSPADLTQEAVTTLPDGDGQGDAGSGQYTIVATTTECSGRCGPVEIIEGLPHSYCDVGDTDSESWTAVQDSGHLTIEEVDFSFDMRAEGGVNADGSFDVGGFATHLAGSLEGTVRIVGTLSPPDTEGGPGELEGTARAHTVGSVEDVPVDCVATFELEPSSF